jgi:hypothetical protein
LDGVDLDALLNRLDVRTERVAFTYAPPADYHPAWRNQFYVFNLIERLAETAAQDEVCFLFDSDCFWVRSADAFAQQVEQDGLASYVLDIPADYPQHGLTREQMAVLFAELDGTDRRSPPPISAEKYLPLWGATPHA